MDIWSFVRVSGFLSSHDIDSVQRSTKEACAESLVFRDNPVYPYGLPERRRYRDFGKRSLDRFSVHTLPSPQYLGHLTWPFLDPSTRRSLCAAIPQMTDYATLRLEASVQRGAIREFLKKPRLDPSIEPQLCPERSRKMGAALIAFNLDYGDMVRWLGGEYTNDHRDWGELSERIEETRQFMQRPGYPKIEYDLALEACTAGVPLAGHYTSRHIHAAKRIDYDNHGPLSDNLDSVRAKFGKEEANSFHLPLPKFLAYFIPGLMISPLSWVIQKGKGRIVVDSSTNLSPDDTGAPNDQIPKAGAAGKERENPPIYYGTAIRRHLENLWNLRLDNPEEDILQHSDDIDAAFRRMLYHPDLAIAFAYVFMEFLIIPVGQIFGARHAPSWWCQPAELRAHMGATLDYTERSIPLAEDVVLSAEPTADEKRAFVQAIPDAIHQGTPAEFKDRHNHVMFVDDNVCSSIRPHMTETIKSAVGSAYDCFGKPERDRRASCLQPLKFNLTAGPEIHHLGFDFNSRSMRMAWPADKQAAVLAMTEEWLRHRTSRTPGQVSKLLGNIRNGAMLCPLGDFLSIRLQLTLSAAVKRAGQKQTTKRRWWHNHKVHIPAEVFHDLEMLRRSLLPEAADSKGNTVWSRPISLLVRREPTCTVLSDAAYSGIGGWSPSLKFMWRIKREELMNLGFKMRAIDAFGEAARVADPENLHINLLEFVAIIINIWLVIHFVRQEPDKPGGHIVEILADNTSALSWMRHASRNRRTEVRNLAYLCQCLIIFSQTSEFANYEGSHIAGKDNVEADALSRPENHPTLASAIDQYSPLQTCQVFLLPSALLSLIARALSSQEIGEQFVNETIAVLTLKPHISSAGVNATSSHRGTFRRSHHGKASR